MNSRVYYLQNYTGNNGNCCRTNHGRWSDRNVRHWPTLGHPHPPVSTKSLGRQPQIKGTFWKFISINVNILKDTWDNAMFLCLLVYCCIFFYSIITTYDFNYSQKKVYTMWNDIYIWNVITYVYFVFFGGLTWSLSAWCSGREKERGFRKVITKRDNKYKCPFTTAQPYNICLLSKPRKRWGREGGWLQHHYGARCLHVPTPSPWT